MGEHAQANSYLDAVVQSHPSHEGFAAWLLLAEVHWAGGDRQTALSVLDRLCRVSHLIAHQIVLARCHLELDQKQAARAILEEAIADYARAIPEVKRQSAKDIRTVRRLLHRLSPQV
jgi:tetratricopeptide (TPR) repeat protein